MYFEPFNKKSKTILYTIELDSLGKLVILFHVSIVINYRF